MFLLTGCCCYLHVVSCQPLDPQRASGPDRSAHQQSPNSTTHSHNSPIACHMDRLDLLAQKGHIWKTVSRGENRVNNPWSPSRGHDKEHPVNVWNGHKEKKLIPSSGSKQRSHVDTEATQRQEGQNAGSFDSEAWILTAGSSFHDII